MGHSFATQSLLLAPPLPFSPPQSHNIQCQVGSCLGSSSFLLIDCCRLSTLANKVQKIDEIKCWQVYINYNKTGRSSATTY